jgi:hypothetical protein
MKLASHGSLHEPQKKRTEQNRTEKNRTEKKRTEQNRKEQKRKEKKGEERKMRLWIFFKLRGELHIRIVLKNNVIG